MGLLDRITSVFKKEDADECASGYPNWAPTANWKPEFEDELQPEAYDAN